MTAVSVPRPYGFRVSPDDEAVSKARRRILAVVRGWAVLLSDEALSDLALMSSEVVTNAVRHTGASCAVVVRWTGARLRVEVTDVDPREPKAGDGALDAESGRGLLLVESLAADWGCVPVVAGKVVWFEVGLASSRTGTQRLSALVRAAVPSAALDGGYARARRARPYVFPRHPLAVVGRRFRRLASTAGGRGA